MLKKFILILLLSFMICSEALAGSGGLNIFAYPRAVPETQIYNPYGQKTKLKDFKNQFVVLVLWSKNCMPCIRELDNLKAFADKVQDDGIKVVILSSENDWTGWDEQNKILDKFGGAGLDAYVDKDSKLIEDFGVFSFPHTVLINRQGEEIGRIRGAVEWDSDEVIEQIYKIKAQNG